MIFEYEKLSGFLSLGHSILRLWIQHWSPLRKLSQEYALQALGFQFTRIEIWYFENYNEKKNLLFTKQLHFSDHLYHWKRDSEKSS